VGGGKRGTSRAAAAQESPARHFRERARGTNRVRVSGRHAFGNSLVQGFREPRTTNDQQRAGNYAVTPRNVAWQGSMRGRNVLCGRGCAFAEEELLHLFYDHFLILLARRIQTIFIEQHLAILGPLAPGLL
jgi:hypothetical protein